MTKISNFGKSRTQSSGLWQCFIPMSLPVTVVTIVGILVVLDRVYLVPDVVSSFSDV